MFTRQELIDWVASRLDEVLLSSDVDAPVSNVERELDVAAETVIKQVRREHLFSLIKSGKESTIVEGVIHVPVDMARFIRLKLSDWKRPVDALISTDDPAYRAQHNAHLRGSIYKPVAALVSCPDAESLRGIEYFSSEEDEIEEFSYIPATAAEKMPDILINGVVWTAVSTILSISRFGNEAKFAREQALAAINNINIGLHG